MDPEIRNHSDRIMERLQAIDLAYEDYAKAVGMTYISLTILETIYDNRNDCTQKLICKLTHYPKQSVNLAVKSFWESGYVELRETPADRRNKQIYLTEKGRKFADEKIKPLWDADGLAMERLNKQQREELMRLTEIYGQSFCDIIAEIIQKHKSTDKEGSQFGGTDFG